MRKILLATAVFGLAFVFGSGILYSVGLEKTTMEVKLPESQFEDLGIRTVGKGKTCKCSSATCIKKGKKSEYRSIMWIGASTKFDTDDACTANCHSWCKGEAEKSCNSDEDPSIPSSSCSD